MFHLFPISLRSSGLFKFSTVHGFLDVSEDDWIECVLIGFVYVTNWDD